MRIKPTLEGLESRELPSTMPFMPGYGPAWSRLMPTHHGTGAGTYSPYGPGLRLTGNIVIDGHATSASGVWAISGIQATGWFRLSNGLTMLFQGSLSNLTWVGSDGTSGHASLMLVAGTWALTF